MNKTIQTAINLETTVLVAVWSSPSIFQGYFKIIEDGNTHEQFLFYRCECDLSESIPFHEQNFSPYNYQFTHLYHDSAEIKNMGQNDQDALYLLKYALYITLTYMISNQKQYLTYIDEIALTAITQRVANLLSNDSSAQENEDIGFAVAIDINPTEPMSQSAVDSLLALAKMY